MGIGNPLETGRVVADRALAVPAETASSLVASRFDPSRFPEYGDWFPQIWDEYLHDLVGWRHKSSWAHLPATFRWHEFYERIASAMSARSAETGGLSPQDASAVPQADAQTPSPNSTQDTQ